MLPSLDESVETEYESAEPKYKFFTDFMVKVFLTNGFDTETEIGFLKGTSIETIVTQIDDFVMICDGISGELFRIAETITDKDGQIKESICPQDGNLMYIDNIYVEEKYRGMGIGKYLLDNINSILLRSLNFYHHAFLLIPAPQVKNNDDSLRNSQTATPEETERLVNFYKKDGFRFVGDSECMYRVQENKLFKMLGIS